VNNLRYAKGIKINYYQTHCPNPECDYPLDVFEKEIHSGIVKCPKCGQHFGLLREGNP
jgi:ssDNA-binding Zn-finger/Zn-ribbon topoisomerase 1